MPSEFDLFDECEAVDGVRKLDVFDAEDSDGLADFVLARLYARPSLGWRENLLPSDPLNDPLDPRPVLPP